MLRGAGILRYFASFRSRRRRDRLLTTGICRASCKSAPLSANYRSNRRALYPTGPGATRRRGITAQRLRGMIALAQRLDCSRVGRYSLYVLVGMVRVGVGMRGSCMVMSANGMQCETMRARGRGRWEEGACGRGSGASAGRGGSRAGARFGEVVHPQAWHALGGRRRWGAAGFFVGQQGMGQG